MSEPTPATDLRSKLLGFYGVNRGRVIPNEEIQKYATSYMEALVELIRATNALSMDKDAEDVDNAVSCAMMECYITFHEARYLATSPEDSPERVEFINGTTNLPPVDILPKLAEAVRASNAESLKMIRTPSGIPIFPALVRYLQYLDEQDAAEQLAKAREKILARVRQ